MRTILEMNFNKLSIVKAASILSLTGLILTSCKKTDYLDVEATDRPLWLLK